MQVKYVDTRCQFADIRTIGTHDDQDQIQRALWTMDVEQVQQKFIATGSQNADLQFEEFAGPVWTIEQGRMRMVVVFSVAQRYLRSIYGRGVCLLGFRAMSLC